MKRFIAIMLCICMLAAMPFCAYASAENIRLTPAYKICIGADESLTAAAAYLNRYIGEICGFSLDVCSAVSEDGCICLAVDSAVQSGYTIKTDTRDIFITGASVRNVVDGICAFLHKYGGITYYTSRVVARESDAICIPQNEAYTYTPYFENTETDWYSPCDVDYSLFNGISGNLYRTVPGELGGGIEYISGFAHTFTNQFCSAEKYYETDPECFGRFIGIRSKKVLCLTNPKTLEIVTNEVLELLREKHDPSADLQIISLTQNDTPLFCTCPECVAGYIKYGAISGVMLQFVNAVAETVRKAGYENVAIDTFAYMYTRSAPKRIVPAENVIVRLCSLECCFSHPLNDPLCAVNVGFAKDLRDWSAICDRLYVWDYVTNFAHYIGLFPNFDVLQANLQFFSENHVKGIYEEGNYAMSPCDTEFGELRAYLICKLMQDPYCDLEAERAAFLQAYYGEGGSAIGTFLDKVCRNAASEHLSIYSSMWDTCILSCREIAECDALWQTAKNAANGEARTHVESSELAWRYWKYCNNASEFADITTRREMRAQFDADLAATEIKAYRECSETKAFFLGILQKLRFVLSIVIDPFLYLIQLFR